MKLRRGWPLVTLLVGGLALALPAGVARAQDDEDARSEDVEEVEEAEGADEAEADARPARAARRTTDDAPPLGGLEAHAVRVGDTLWDLCAKYLNSPWYWPKIWSYNPQLTNPHWIFPGNEVRFYPGDDALPTQVDIARTVSTSVDDDLTIPGQLTDEELVQTVGTIETGRGPANSVWTSFIGYLSKDAVKRAGRVEASPSDAVLLADGDKLYVRGESSLKRGDKLAIFTATREVVHPITGESYGYAVEITGGLEVLELTPEVAVARVDRAYRAIMRGDLVGRFPANFFARVQPSPNTAEAKGYIIETASEVLGPLGEHHMVYVDRGRRHGVQNGNTFTVYQRGDGYTGATKGYPNESVGTLMVVDAQEDASTAIVVRSVRDIAVGDKIEMQPER